MAYDIRKIKDTTDLIGYFSENLGWNIDMDYVDDIEDISYDFTAADIGLKDDAFARISALRQMQPLVDGQKWGIFCVEFDSQRFEVGALRKILSKLIPRRRNSADHAVWDQQDLLFICNWGKDNNRTIGLAHFEDQGNDLPQIRMISCAPAVEDFTQIKTFEDRLSLLRWPKDTSNIEEWRRTWASAFTTGYREVIQTSAMLTTRLAAEAQNIRNHILEILEVETRNGYVHLLFDKFRNTLIHDMSDTQFADMYAQTVVYGLFSARCMDTTQENFSASEAVDCIPNTNPFLKNLMRECLGANDRSRLSFDELEIGNVVELLRNTRTDSIIQDFNRQTGGGREDPVIHFYEEFLTAYDKAQKVQRGVYYTPQPVVNFIVRAVDDILKTEFGLPEGLASTATKQIKVQRKSERKVNGMYRMVEANETVPAVQVLDPATGTGTFLRQVILQIYENFKQQHRGESNDAVQRAWNEYVPKHLLPRINGFELMMAPYAVAHMKLAMVLKDTGYNFKGQSRLNVCLTNTLEAPGNSESQMSIFEDDPLAMESIEANKVKKNNGISVFIGNPPYSSSSINKNDWILDLMQGYKVEPGGVQKLQEKKNWLDDDYVKFIRDAQYAADGTDAAIVAFINPHGWLENGGFRGMRWSLLSSFDTVYVLNLHGNARKQETCPDGSKDENVFDIQQGVAINIFVKNSKKRTTYQTTRVLYFDMYGLRDEKYKQLNALSIDRINWTELALQLPMLYLYPRNNTGIEDYSKGWSLPDIFTNYAQGIMTANDACVMYDSQSEAEATISQLLGGSYDDAKLALEQRAKLPKNWSLEAALADLREGYSVCKINYRPFDDKYTAYTGKSCGWMWRPRTEVMRHLSSEGENYCLIVPRIIQKGDSFTHAFIANAMVDKGILSSKDNAFVFPLYTIAAEFGSTAKHSNISEGFIHEVRKIDVDATVEDIFFYIYAVLYSNKYRQQFKTFLISEFAKIPVPCDVDSFRSLTLLGSRLVQVQLLQVLSDTTVTLCGSSSPTIVSVDYKERKLYLNKNDYIEGISPEVWEYQIGSYQPLQKWLKDRKGRVFSQSDFEHYKHMVAAIDETLRLTRKIDEVIEL